MPKTPPTLFSCSKCGAQYPKWTGRCSECGGWGTVSEDASAPASASAHRTRTTPGKPQAFHEIDAKIKLTKHATSIAYLDRLWGGGLVSGSVTLIGGEPGIGKSTLLAQLGCALAMAGKRVLYVTGEESPQQVRHRLERLCKTLPETFFFLDQTSADTIASTIEHEKPDLTIIDSVQTLRLAGVTGEPGNPTQVKASAAVINEAAKRANAAVIFVGQVTKDGDLAGPRLLEHLVDTVMMLEGDRTHDVRILRVIKHRFGSTEESAILSMQEQGLEELTDPSAVLLQDRPTNVPGSLVSCLMEGSRPILVEVQALVSSAGYGTPSRRATGVDPNRLSLLLAVLARRAGLGFGESDVFANIVGGIDARTPALDLALALALASAKTDVSIPAHYAAWGEVGLSGEIRPVPQTALRIKEAARLNLNTILIPHEQTLPVAPKGVTLIPCRTIREAIQTLNLKKV